MVGGGLQASPDLPSLQPPAEVLRGARRGSVDESLTGWLYRLSAAVAAAGGTPCTRGELFVRTP